VIWADLEPSPTIGTQAGEQMESNALKHLKSLMNESTGRFAQDYIRKTPKQINTRLRRRLRKEYGWEDIRTESDPSWG